MGSIHAVWWPCRVRTRAASCHSVPARELTELLTALRRRGGFPPPLTRAPDNTDLFGATGTATQAAPGGGYAAGKQRNVVPMIKSLGATREEAIIR